MKKNQLKRFCSGGGESRAPANTKNSSNQASIKIDEKVIIRSEIKNKS